jgi:hypothetical protein
MIQRETVDTTAFNPKAVLPYELRLKDFEIAMQDVYDFFYDVNTLFEAKGLPRLEDELRAAIMSGMLSDMLTASLAKHSRTLIANRYHNGHPDLIVQGKHVDDKAKAAPEGVEIKTTRKKGGAVDTHGGRDQWMCAFVYQIDQKTQPAQNRAPTRFTEIYLNNVVALDFRDNARGRLGTRTSTLGAAGMQKLRSNWIYIVK